MPSNTYNETDFATADYLKGIGVKYRAEYLFHDRENNHDNFACILYGPKSIETFDFFAGIGHRINVKKRSFSPPNVRKANAQASKLGLDNLILATEIADNYTHGNRKRLIIDQPAEQYIPRPSSASVLHCLLSDARCGEETFAYFCAELGYDPDSIRARETYFACQANAKKLTKIFTAEQITELEAMLEDY